ncbi:MAG: hypothetical protein FWB75_07390 [Oscillospiraceae bacterium]|nr:hypothetical protein [Oscillospiraceae bacterium]
MKKRRIIAACCLLVLFGAGVYFAVSAYYNRNQYLADVTMIMAIHPPMRAEVYYIVLRNDGSLTSSRGTRQRSTHRSLQVFMRNPLRRTFLRTVREIIEVQLSKEEYFRLINIAETFPSGGYDSNRVVLGAGWIEVFYRGAYFFEFYTRSGQGTNFREALFHLLYEIVEMSPLEIRLRTD